MRRAGLAALAGYTALSFLFFGLRLLTEPGGQYVGPNDDPQLFVWSFAWWPHAILHGQNPFVTADVWAPHGLNLAWVTAVPALAIALAPVTLTAGPIVAYNLAAILMPALAAWTAFLLCRRLTSDVWAALAGGYLFGFSSYVLSHEWAGHLHLTAVFLVPLAALVVTDYLTARLGAGGLVLRFGLILATELLISTEVAATGTIALAAALLTAAVTTPRLRPRLRSIVRPLAGAYGLALLVTAPLLYFVLSDFHTETFNSPKSYVSDLAGLVVPTSLSVVHRGWTGWTRYRGNLGENSAFVGLPALLVVVLFACRKRPGRRFVLACLAVAVLLSLGSELRVNGDDVLPLPWLALVHVPVFDNILPARFALYVALVLAVIVALWAHSARGVVRYALPALCALVLLPDPSAGWATSYQIPSFFTSASWRTCIDTGAIVLPLPIAMGGQADLWQVASGFRFRLAGGRLTPQPPSFVSRPPGVAQVAAGGPPVPGETGAVAQFVAREHVDAIVVWDKESDPWAPVLEPLAHGVDEGGIVLYNLSPLPPGCLGQLTAAH